MFTESAELYDAIYGAFKDYEAEAAAVATLIRGVNPAARTVLDVACGTGEHVRLLRGRHGLLADGLDLDPALLGVARRKVTDARFVEADMGAFTLGRAYDAVICMFSSIGYLKTIERVTAALRCFRATANRDGVIIVEPWFPPGALRLGPGEVRRAEHGAIRVARSSHVAVEGGVSILTFDYEIADATGIRHAKEVHELGLFTPEEMLACFREAGLEASFDRQGITGRGLYIARVER